MTPVLIDLFFFHLEITTYYIKVTLLQRDSEGSSVGGPLEGEMSTYFLLRLISLRRNDNLSAPFKLKLMRFLLELGIVGEKGIY